MSALRELIAFFGVQVDDKPLEHANERMDKLAETATRAGELIGLAFGIKEIGEFITKQIELGAELAHTSEILGLSVEQLQGFQYAAANAGLGADEANTALRFLNKNLGAAAEGGGDGAATFAKLGVQIKDATGNIRPTSDILTDVADGFTKLKSPAEKTATAMSIFGRAGARMIPLLNKGSKGIEELREEFDALGGGVSEEFVHQAEEGEHSLIKLRLVGKGLASTVASALIPAFTSIVEKVAAAAGWFRKFSEHSYIVQTALATLGAISAGLALTWAIMNIEVILAVAAIALLVLIVDDVYTAFKGGKSVIGDFIDSLFGVGTTQAVVQALAAAVMLLWGDLGMLWQAAMDLGAALGVTSTSATAGSTALEVLHQSGLQVAAVFNGIVATLDLVAAQVSVVINTVTTLTKKFNELRAAQPDLVNELADIALPGAGAGLRHGLAALSAGDGPGAPSTTVSTPAFHRPTVAGDVNKTTNVDITVNGNADKSTAQEMGRQVVNATGSDNQDAYAAVPSGGGH